MPIIQPPDTDAPLCQGDILDGPKLHITNVIGQERDGEAAALPGALCMVVSRPCVALRKNEIVVASVRKAQNKHSLSFDSFDEICDYFTCIRDGSEAPDVFYLGQIPTVPGCFVAHLGSLHTFKLPEEPKRTEFVKKNRIATLCPDFSRDLHLRIFRAYASLGFDDYGWHSTEDLKAIVLVGERDIKKSEADLSTLEAQFQAGVSQGFGHESEKDKLTKELGKLKKKLDELKTKCAPYAAELSGRHA